MLRAAIARALAGHGGFRMVAQGRVIAPGSAPDAGDQLGIDWSQGAGRAVLWPMDNAPQTIWHLLRALDAGIVPLLLPAAPPPAKVADLRARYPGFGLYAGAHIEWPALPLQVEPDLYFGLLTSGSTGEPKAIVTSAARLAHGIRGIHVAQGLDDIGHTGVLLPLAYSFACVNQLLWSLLYERALHLPEPLSDMANCLARIRASGIDMLCMVPHQARALSKLAGAAEPLPAVHCVNFAGATFPLAEFAFLRRLFPQARLLNNYGCAEAMPRLTCLEITSAAAPVGQVGQPIGDIALRIDGDVASGPLLFHGSSTALGTICAEGKLQAFDAWIASGDLGMLDASGLRILGRHDQVIKIGGERLSLLEVEQALLAFGASQVLVWLATDSERIIAIIHMPAPPALPALLQWLRARLPGPLLPAEIYWTAQWKINANQKANRPALQTLARSGKLQRIWPANKPSATM
jgi:acyl-coenzyme A synthetase/AMP-(fatty) acid ligase